MTNLLEIKDRLIRFYSKYETYLFPVVKFIVAIVLFTVINMNIGFMEKISRFPIGIGMCNSAGKCDNLAGGICCSCRYVCLVDGSCGNNTGAFCSIVFLIFSVCTQRWFRSSTHTGLL